MKKTIQVVSIVVILFFVLFRPAREAKASVRFHDTGYANNTSLIFTDLYTAEFDFMIETSELSGYYYQFLEFSDSESDPYFYYDGAFHVYASSDGPAYALTENTWYHVKVIHGATRDVVTINNNPYIDVDNYHYTYSGYPIIRHAWYGSSKPYQIKNFKLSDGSGVVGEWPLNETAGTTGNDISGNDNDLTLYPDFDWLAGSTPQPSGTGLCTWWYNGKYSGNPDLGTWRVHNDHTAKILRVEIHGIFCDPVNGTPCGIGVAGVDPYYVSVNDYGVQWPDYYFVQTSDWHHGEELEFRTQWQIMSVECLYENNDYSLGTTPPGKTTRNPDYDGPIQTEDACTDLYYSVPVINWNFSFPDWWCRFKIWFNDLIFLDTDYAIMKYEEVNTAVNEHIPFYYTSGILNLDWGSTLGTPSGTIPDFDLTFQPKLKAGDPDPIVIHVDGSVFDPVVPFVSMIRFSFRILLWVTFVFVAIKMSDLL
jgi:hypothetical protein